MCVYVCGASVVCVWCVRGHMEEAQHIHCLPRAKNALAPITVQVTCSEEENANHVGVKQ